MKELTESCAAMIYIILTSTIDLIIILHTPVMVARNSWRVYGEGITIGRSASSGISGGNGRAVSIEYRA